MVISLLHPSRNRPEQCLKTFNKWFDLSGWKTGNFEIEYILSIDDDDEKKDEYFKIIPSRIICSKNRSAIDAINKAAEISIGNILIVVSDDFDCPQDWGTKLIEATKDKKDWIAKTPDGIQKWIITLPIMDREYYNRFGYIYHPDFLHMFADTEMSCVADLTGRKINLNIPFSHNHYSTGRTPKDSVNERADKTWEQGEKTFLEHAKNNFGLTNPPGKIQDGSYVKWARSKGVII